MTPEPAEDPQHAVPAPAARQEAAAVQRPPLFSSDDLLRGHRAVEISHNGVVYRLQATRLGKLILTK